MNQGWFNGPGIGTLDARYLKLDASNGPITGNLALTPSSAVAALTITNNSTSKYITTGGGEFDVIDNGSVLTAGYLRVGSVSAPTNTTAGDITGVRLSIGNTTIPANSNSALFIRPSTVTPTLGTNTNFIDQSVTVTPDNSGNENAFGYLLTMAVQPSAANGGQFTGFGFTVKHDSGAFNLSGASAVLGVSGFVQQNVAATTVAAMSAFRGTVQHLAGTTTASRAFDARIGVSGDAGTGTTAVGFDIGAVNIPSGGYGTIKGLNVINLSGASVTTAIGVDIAAQSGAATTNIGLRIAASGAATTNYALQLSDTGGTAAGGITFGTETTLYRAAANILKTDNAFYTVLEGRITTYLRVGSLSVPTNTSAGDITAGRIRLTGNGGSDGSFSAGSFFAAANSATNTAGGAVTIMTVANSVVPTANSTSEFRVMNMSNSLGATSASTLGTVTAFHGEGGRYAANQTGLVSIIQGANLNGAIVDSSSPPNPSATTVRGAILVGASRPSGTSAFTATTIISADLQPVVSGSVTATTVQGANVTNPVLTLTSTSIIGYDHQATFNQNIATLAAGFRATVPVSSATGNFGFVIPSATLTFTQAATTTNQHGISVGIMTYNNTTGAISTINATPVAAGSGYAVNDRLTITTGGALSEVNIDTVDGSGGVTAVSLIAGGFNYTTGTKSTAYKSGFSGGGSLGTNNGAGCTISVTAITTGKTLTNAASIYVAGAPVASTGVTITNGPYSLWIDAGTSAFGGNIVPDANDGAAIGTTALQWSDLFLAEGGVINWDNGDATLTQTNNVVALAGATFSLDNKISTYNNIATVSGGVPSELATIDSTGLTANVGATTLYAVPAAGEGLYRVNAYVVETTAGSISSVLPNVQIVYTDKDSNTAVTLDATPILAAAGLGQTGALTTNTAGTASSGVVVIYVKASTTIQYQTVNYASNIAGMTYALRIKLEAL